MNQPPSSGASSEQLLDGLRAATAALTANDLPAAAEALAGVEAICLAATAEKRTLPSAQLAQCRELYVACLAAAERSSAGLLTSLLQSARTRTATDAYRNG
jgi:hypothetical protein